MKSHLASEKRHNFAINLSDKEKYEGKKNLMYAGGRGDVLGILQTQIFMLSMGREERVTQNMMQVRDSNECSIAKRPAEH